MAQENEDLCKTCNHHWFDFPMKPEKHCVPHCEIVDEKYGFENMDYFVDYPCLKCPFDSYIKKNK